MQRRPAARRCDPRAREAGGQRGRQQLDLTDGLPGARVRLHRAIGWEPRADTNSRRLNLTWAGVQE